MLKGILTFLVFIVCVSCVSNVETNVSFEKSDGAFQAVLQEAMDDSHDGIRGVSMSVLAPDINVEWSGAVGFDSKERTDTLSASQPFRIASITKTYVAAAILRLHELGELDIDDSISNYISKKHLEILREGGYSPDSISLRQCLNHTSGLFDYAMGGNTFIEKSMKNPDKRWSRTDQLEIAMESGKRIGYPGEKYRYSDTGYILAGETIEMLTDSSLAFGLRNLLKFDELGMTSTWLESLEEEPRNQPDFVHCYFRNKEATYFDPSIDLYGGGGLVSNTKDLARFIFELGSGGIFDNDETFDLMTSDVTYDENYDFAEDRRYKEYKLGLWRISMYGTDVYMHSGLWGVHHAYIPEYNASIAMNFTRNFPSRSFKKAILIIKNLHEKAN